MKDLAGKVVAVTGAASGIGRALAQCLAQEGAALALADIDAAGLARTADGIDGSPRVTTHVVDVSDPEAVAGYARAAREQHGAVDVVINNAGVATVATVEASTYDDFAWVLGVNLWGTIHGVKAFLPLLRERPEAHIVNISSVAGYLPFPTNGPYSVSKYGVTALSETLMAELWGTSIHVSCVHPGGVKTAISRNTRYTTADDHAQFERMARLTPARAARIIVKGIKRNRRRILVGADARLMALFRWLFPIRTLGLVSWMWRRMTAGRTG